MREKNNCFTLGSPVKRERITEKQIKKITRSFPGLGRLIKKEFIKLPFSKDSFNIPGNNLASFQGFLWHGGKLRQYTKPFRENVATTVGIFFDGIAGTLTYYKDGVSLGVAFDRLNEIAEPLYPIVCSTAAKTEMSLGVMKREFVSIQVNKQNPMLYDFQTRLEKLTHRLQHCGQS